MNSEPKIILFSQTKSMYDASFLSLDWYVMESLLECSVLQSVLEVSAQRAKMSASGSEPTKWPRMELTHFRMEPKTGKTVESI